MLKKSTRKEMEQYVYDVYDKFDPSGKNTTIYKKLFSGMNDKEFEEYAVQMFNDHTLFHCMEMEGYVNEPTMDTIEAAAKVAGVQLYEYVAYPYMSKNPDEPFVTRYPVPVGYVHIKRLQQMKRKKNSTSTRIDQRDAKTGQVIGHDKNSRSSDNENYSMMVYGAKEGVKEFMSFRADDMKMKSEAYSDIYKNGYVDMNKLTNDVANKKTLNTLDVYLTSMGLRSDLIQDGYVLRDTIEDKDLK